MATGNYGQLERNRWRYQYASKGMLYAWQELFHKSANEGFENTKTILVSLLSTNVTFTNNILKRIVDDYIADCEKNNTYPLNYYYVKYGEYRPGSYGKLSNKNAKTDTYMFSVLQTKSQWSQNTYMPFLKAADSSHISKDDMGQRLVYGDKHIICTNSSYLLRENKGENIVNTINISQNKDGIDIEDRVVVLKNYISAHF